MDSSFPALLSRSNKNGDNTKIDASVEAGSRRYWFTGEGHCRQQTLDREERAALREAQKMQAQADIELAKIRAEADRAEADPEAEEKKRADEIRLAQIEIEKQLKIKEMELQAQQAQVQATTSSATTPPPRNKDAKWLELSGSSPDNFDALVDLIVKEQFINACSEDLAMYLLERGPKDLVELTTWAQKYLIAHKEQLGKSKTTVQPRRADQKKTTQSKPDS